MPRTHYLSDEHVHYKSDTGNEPALMIDSGDTVAVLTQDVSDNQIGPESDGVIPGNGLLPELADAYLKVFDLTPGHHGCALPSPTN
jgi:acetamidase/formamidase